MFVVVNIKFLIDVVVLIIVCSSLTRCTFDSGVRGKSFSRFFRCDIWPERKTDRGENYSRGLENDPDHSKMSFHSIHKAATLGRIFNVEMIFEF